MTNHDEGIEPALRATEPEIADAGFSERLLARLPPKKARRAVPRRWTLAGAAAVGSLATILLAPSVEGVIGFSVPFAGTTPILTFAALLAVAAGPVFWLLRD